MEEMMSLRMEQMKKLQSAQTANRDGVLANALAALANQFRADWTNRLENALLSRAQLRTCRAVSAKLEEGFHGTLKERHHRLGRGLCAFA